MGKIIARRIHGMNLWAKVALITLCTLLVSVFMYEGWYKPLQVQAATVTYQASVPDTTTDLVADSTCNTTSGAPNSVTANLKDTMSTTYTTSASRYYPTTGLANGVTTSVAKFYGPVYASSTAITAPSASVAVRGYNTNLLDAWTFHLYEYDPAGAAGNKRLLATSSTVVPGTTSVYTAVPTYNLDANNIVASGHRLMMEITYTPSGTILTPRIYLDGTTSAAWTQLTVTETADTVPPTVSSTTPANAAAGVTPNSSLTVLFNENVNCASALASNISMPGATVGAPSSCSAATVVYPITGQTNSTLYTYSISGVQDSAGNTMTTVTGRTYTTAAAVDSTPPTISSTNPSNGQTGVALNTSLQVVFSENVDCATAAASNISVAGATIGTPACTSATITYPVSGQLNNTLYTYSVQNVKDLAGNTMVTVSGRTYTTVAAASCTANSPTLVMIPTSATILPGGTAATYEARLYNNDTGTGCTAITATLNAVANNNATDFTFGTLSKTSMSAAAGLYDVATFTVTAKATAPQNAQNVSTVSVSTASRMPTPSTVQATTTSSTFSSPLMHNATNTGSTKSGGIWGNNKDCTWCHTSGSANIKQVSVNITKLSGQVRPVVFTRLSASVANTQGTFGDDLRTTYNSASRNICEVCHHQTKYHQYSANSGRLTATDHYNRKDCINCHSHDKAFKASCGSCHMATPTSGSHTFHAVTKVMLCATCHYGSTGSGATHNETPSKNSIGFWINNVNVPSWSTNSATGTFNSYSGVNTNSSNPNTVVPGVGVGSCNVYCHGNWTNSGGVTNARWSGGASQAACGTCHGATNALPPTTNAHAKHTGVAAGQYSIACASCHGTLSTAHINGTVTLALTEGTYSRTTGLAAPSLATGTCANTYCHSNGTSLGVPVANNSVAWNLTTNCGSCHTSPMNTGSHAKHVTTYAYTCDYCHAKTAANNTSIISPARHANRFNNVSANTAKTNQFTINASNQCSNTYCHSNGTNFITPVANTTVAWGAVGAVNCGSCHATPMTTGSHDRHVPTYSCDYCHVKTTADGSTISSPARHANKFNNVSGSATRLLFSRFTYDNVLNTCSTFQCHGTVMTWGTGDTNNATCTKCHGTPSTLDTNANRAPATNAHQAHVHGAVSYGYSSELTCYECHNSGPTITFTGHMNGSTTVIFTNASTAGANATPTSWTAATKTCSVYCHGVAMPKGDIGGAVRTPAWTNATLMNGTQANDCSRCHGFPPTTGSTQSISSHAAYISQPNSCTTCHTHFNGTNGFATEANRRLHIDGIVQVNADCNGCHDYDVVGSTYTSGVWSGGSWGKSSYDGLTPNEGAGAHAKHINYIKTRLAYGSGVMLNAVSQTYGAAGSDGVKVCGTCHSNALADHQDVANLRNIFPAGGPYLMGGTGGTSLIFGSVNPSYSIVNKTCSNISCHYLTTPKW